MKIDKVGDESKSGKPQPIASLFAPALSEKISKVTDPLVRAEMGQLIGDIEERGKRLYASKGRKEFEDYKAAVKKFMQKVVGTSFKMEEKHGQKKDGKFVVYLTMEKVDEALEHLAQMLLVGQQDSMRLVAALNEIRGMLMDLYL